MARSLIRTATVSATNRPIKIDDLVVFESNLIKGRVFRVRSVGLEDAESHFLWGVEMGYIEQTTKGSIGTDPGNQLLPRARIRHATKEEIAAAVARRIQGQESEPKNYLDNPGFEPRWTRHYTRQVTV